MTVEATPGDPETPGTAAPPREPELPREPEAEETSLWDAVRERCLSVSTLDRPLRTATGAALGCMLGAAVLVALRDAGQPGITVGVVGGVRTTLATPLFTATLVFCAVGLGYLLTGLVFAHRVAAAAGVLLLTGLIGYETGVLPVGGLRAVLPGWATSVTRGLLVAILLMTAVVLFLRRGRHGDAVRDRRLRAAALVASVALVGGYLLVLRVASPVVNGLDNFPGTVDLLMVDVALLATPLLQIAAVDFGDWGEIAAERVQALRRPTGARRWVVPAVGCVALVVVGLLRASDLGAAARAGGSALLLLGVGLAVALGIGRLMRLGRMAWPGRISVAVLFAVTATSLWVVLPLVARSTGALTVHPSPTVSERGEYTAAAEVRSVRGTGGFTVLVPAGWQTRSSNGMDGFAGEAPGGGTVSLVVAVEPVRLPPEAFAPLLKVHPAGGSQADGSLTRLQVDPGGAARGWLWTAPVPGEPQKTYLLDGTVTGAQPEGATQQLEALVHSFRPAGAAPATVPVTADEETPAAARAATTDRLQALGIGIDTVLSLLVVVLLGTVGRRWPAQVRIAAVVFAVVSLFTALYFGDTVARTIAGPSTAWPVLTESGALTAIGVLGLLALAGTTGRSTSWAQRLPGTLTGLVGGTLALAAMEALYDHALRASRIAVWAAVIVLVAVAWDVSMSGEAMTNHGTRLWPRTSRLLMFLGYTILVGATVVYYGGLHSAASGKGVEAYFEPEAITDAALMRVALPVLVLLFLVRTFGAAGARPGGDPAPGRHARHHIGPSDDRGADQYSRVPPSG